MTTLKRPELKPATLTAVLTMALVGTLFLFAPAPRPTLAQGLDLDVIFNCAADGPIGEQTPERCLASRDVLLNNCTACHTFVPIVKAQKPAELWDSTLEVHRTRVPQLSDEQYEELRLFLKAHFNDVQPAPTLPPELEALGTGLPF
jgi:hypothetical protein